MRRKLILILLFTGAFATLSAQDVEYYTQIVKELASTQMESRGYVGDGVCKAEKYIVERHRHIGVPTPVLHSFKQSINTFPSEVRMSVKATQEYEIFRVRQDQEYISDFDKEMEKYLKGGK